MKVHLIFLFGFVLVSSVCPFSQTVPAGVPVPPGYGQPPPVIYIPSSPARTPRFTADVATWQREAKELMELSQTVQPEIESLRHGLLAKDLTLKLKRIEKLSKHLREEIAPLGN